MTAAGPLEVASWYEEETDYLGGPQHWDDEEPDIFEEPPHSVEDAVSEALYEDWLEEEF